MIKIPIDVQEESIKTKKALVELAKKQSIMRGKKFEELSHNSRSIVKFLKSNAGKGFTAKELYDQFNWEFNGPKEFMEILEKLLTGRSFRIFGDNRENYVNLHYDFIKKGLEGNKYIYYYKLSMLQRIRGRP